jgi:hypothetical protein
VAKDNLPVKTTFGRVTEVTDQTKSLLARGLEAIRSRHLDTAEEEQPAEAQYNIGHKYYDEEDYASAVKWWLKAAQKGHSAAQYELGWAYSNGEGVTKDVAAAHAWFTLSYISPLLHGITELPSPSAWECRTELEEFRNIDVSVRPWFRQSERDPMSKEELTKARELAIELAKSYWTPAETSAAIADTEKYEAYLCSDDAP